MMTPELFRTWRRRHNMNQTEAAAAIGKSRRSINLYEAGDQLIPLTVELACAAIDRGIRSYTPPKGTT